MKLIYTFILILICLNMVFSQESLWDFRGQATSQFTILNNNDKKDFSGNVRYIPRFLYMKNRQNNYIIDFETSANIYTNFEEKANCNLYRFKISISNEQFKTSLGLQKINFGSAQVLRPLQWFDQMLPTDPLKLTDGVYAAVLKYYFPNNANIWAWSLYGNNELKGWEATKTESKTPEFGGRIQIPVPFGEFASTIHKRKSVLLNNSYDETKIGFDGRWDIVVGFWFESVYQYKNSEQLPYQWNKMNTLGIDYTFGVGNGVYVLFEHMNISVSDKIFNSAQNSQISSIMMTYPVSLFDNLLAVSYYSWESNKMSQYLGWQRTYDNFMYNLNIFYYPKDDKSRSSIDNQNNSGYGLQFRITYNH